MSERFKPGDWVWDRDSDEVGEVAYYDRCGWYWVFYSLSENITQVREDALLTLSEYAASFDP